VAAGLGFTGDFAVVMTPSPLLPEGFAVYLRPASGRVHDFRVLDDCDEADELGAAYVVKASFEVWKGLLLGQLDPVEAVLMRRIAIQGDLQPLIERAGHKGLVERVLSRVQTEFMDDVGGKR
jgi:putative sterol carrier protein